MMFCFRSILHIWIILSGFRDTNDFVNLGICKHELQICLKTGVNMKIGDFTFVQRCGYVFWKKKMCQDLSHNLYFEIFICF